MSQSNQTQTEQTTPLMIYAGELAAITGKPTKSIIRLANESKLPKPVKLGRQYAWSRTTILSFLGLM
jgi:predicted DNA-binding transcriptional regulator AlpA